MLNKKMKISVMLTIVIPLGVGQVWANDDHGRHMFTQGLLGAGVGAIAASASGGKSGKGALVGAGTNILGSMLLENLGDNKSSSSSHRLASYVQSRQTFSRQPTPRYDQVSYAKGYREGYAEGYEVAYRDAMRDSRQSGRL